MLELDAATKEAAFATIKQQLAENPILLVMKGTPQFPQCGFSAQVVQLLNEYGVQFGSLNILQDPTLRVAFKEFANWPTFPQLYVQAELIGGCDILVEMHQSGELEALFEPFKSTN